MRAIHLHNVVPTFLENEKIENSEIWNKELTFNIGERIQIVAPSGSGKTSLISFLYGLRKDFTGTITYDKKSIIKFDANNFSGYRKKEISVVFQDLRLFADYTGEQNLTIKRILEPFHEESRINEMAKKLGISSKINNITKTCSYGEQQRIAIIRSLQQPFSFLILDEPFSHLDETNRRIAMELMEEEASIRKACIILADLKPIEYFKADKTLYL